MKENKSERIHLLVSPAEKNAMTEAATARGLNLSSWVRMILLGEARRTNPHETGTKNRRT